jgi:hypothetical protein
MASALIGATASFIIGGGSATNLVPDPAPIGPTLPTQTGPNPKRTGIDGTGLGVAALVEDDGTMIARPNSTIVTILGAAA